MKSVNKSVYLVLFYCGQNLKNWRKNSNYKKLYAAGRKKLAAVHWELCHEVDILQYIFGKPKKLFSKLTSTNKLNLKISDVAITTFKLKNPSTSCVISVEMLSPVLYRKLIVGTTNNYYELDLVKNMVIKKNKKTFKYIFKKDRNQMFVDYMKCFLSNKKKSKRFDFATLKDGIHVTQIIKAMIKSDKTKKFIGI
jgi:predicted dehydrogenase